MTQFLYTTLILLYKGAITFAALFNEKAKLKIKGIKSSQLNLKAFIDANKEDIVFIHCASQGEHEQAQPIIRWILAFTKMNIVVSFFSPSGYNNAHYESNSRVVKCYLPFDTRNKMTRFISKIKPKIAIIVKNEWWWNLLAELNYQKIDSYLISSTIRKTHYFIKYKNKLFTNGLNAFSTIFVIDQESKQNVSNVYKGNIVKAGDTRIDQVNFIKNSDECKIDFPHFDEKETVIIYGSIWETDLISINKLILLYPEAIHLIYPHELDDENIKVIQNNIKNSRLVNNSEEVKSGINIITAMGELKFAYKMATYAYVGGGFGSGIHNILEAAVYNIPTIVGPNHHKSNEAKYLISNECAFSFNTPVELEIIGEKINKEKIRKEIETKLKSYFSPDYSPTEIICQEIFKKSVINV